MTKSDQEIYSKVLNSAKNAYMDMKSAKHKAYMYRAITALLEGADHDK